MPRLPRLLLCLLCVLASSASAQQGLPPSQTTAIAEARAGLDAAGLDESARRDVEAALAAADSAERSADAALEATRALREARTIAERERSSLQQRLAQKPEAAFQQWQKTLPASDDPERFEALLAGERSELQRLRAESTQVGTALAELTAPPPEASAQEAELRLAADDLERRLASLDSSGVTVPAVLDARRLRLAAELRAARAELARREVERDSAALRRQHLELRQRLLQRELADHQQRLELLQRMIAARSDTRLAELVEQLETQQQAVEDIDPAVRAETELNLRLARQLIAVQQALLALRDASRSDEQRRDEVAAALRDTRARVALDADSEALGLILLAERRRLVPATSLARRLEQVRAELAQARLQQIELARQRSTIDDPDSAVRAVLAGEDSDRPAEQVATGERLYQVLAQRADLVPQLDTALQRYVSALEQAEQTLQQLWLDTVALRELLDRQLFWIPSHARVDRDWLARQPAGWADLLKPSRFATSARLLQARLVDSPELPAASLLLALLLLYWRRSAADRLSSLAPPLRRVTGDSYRLSAQALLLTLVAALPWALLIGTLGWTLQRVGDPGKYSHSLGTALVGVAGSVLLLDFLRWLVIDRGLAHMHFRWTRSRRDSLRAALPWLALLLLPSQLFASLAFARGVEIAIDSAARLSLLLFAGFSSALLWRLLAPGQLWTPRGGAPEPQRYRQALRVGLPALLLAIVVGLLVGYVYSGWVLMTCLWQTVWAVVAVALVHGMLGRWFLLGERRLALTRLQAQREAAGSDSASTSASDGGDVLRELGSSDLTLETVNAQTGRLLRALTLALWLAALVWIWAEVLPALGRLDEIALWSAKSVADDGSTVLEQISLKQVVFGLVLLALTFVAARNLPGLLEIGLLSRISIDASTRYAISSVSRYLIVIVGSIIGLGLLGLRWSQLQWLAAALTVGLGFGLQEIFGNFVSGLILLFERPFRVGDVITIGEFSGTVSRIRTRATTLIDFDNKEVVVPNKTFITDRLINWTLSDTRTRITIKVGVAYGSDIGRVHALLRQAAAEHPLVLREPAPSSWFLAFGASSLDFELRVFVDALGDRLPVTNDLNTRIAELFADAGIEIAFPQLDLHVRTLPGTAPPAPSV